MCKLEWMASPEAHCEALGTPESSDSIVEELSGILKGWKKKVIHSLISNHIFNFLVPKYFSTIKS